MTNLALNLKSAETALTFIQDGKVLTDSRTVAATFGKQHKDVLRRISALDCPEDFIERNFALNKYKDKIGRTLPCYHITRDGFVLLVMGFTGKKAMEFKIKYIEAFNEMERALCRHPSDKPVTVAEHQRSLPSGKREIVLSEKAKQEIGGIVNKCCAKAVRDEIKAILKEQEPLTDEERLILANLRAYGESKHRKGRLYGLIDGAFKQSQSCKDMREALSHATPRK